MVGKSGKGRVVVVGMTCFGGPSESQTPFWKWASWVLLLRDLAWWTAGQDEHFQPFFFLVDDMGWTDVGYMGSTFYETPNIDRLASQGMRFTQAYSACTVCSPTRAAILTGQYPARLHITDWIAGHVRPFAKLKVPDWTMHLPLETMNLARLLKPAGFASASIGKWHLGGPAFYPDKQGFDVNIAGTSAGQPPSYFAPYRSPRCRKGPPANSSATGSRTRR